MVLFFTFITIMMGLSMFFISRDKKLALMFIGCMTLTLLSMDIPFFKTPAFFFIGCFLLSEFNNMKTMLIRYMRTPIWQILLIILLSIILCIIYSPHLHSINESRLFLRGEFLLKYFALGYAFFSIRNEKNMRTLIRYSIIPMFILTMFGIVNLLEHRSSFVTAMMSNYSSLNSTTETMGDKFLDADRFRVQAMFYNPFNYGYICCLCFIMYLYGYNKKWIDKVLFVILSVCCFYGILMCGARTVILCSIVGISTYILLAFRVKKTITVGMVTMLVAIMAYLTVPVVNEKVDQMTTMFSDTSGREVGGSSLEMRSVQFATVLLYIRESPAFGKGEYFFNIDLGWRDGYRGLMDERFQGLEGIYLKYLLERGVIGYFLYLSVWLMMLIYLLRSRHINKQLSAFGIAIWVIYTAFANMTGELSSVYPTLLIMGSVIGVFDTKKTLYRLKNEMLNSNSSV